MRVRKISAFIMAFLLVLSSLTLFSFADEEEVILMDSGSPEVSLMALRSIAADDGISLAAAEGNSGQFGYNIEPAPLYFYSSVAMYSDEVGILFRFHLPPGQYSYSVDYNFTPFKGHSVRGFSSGSSFLLSSDIVVNGSTVIYMFTVDDSFDYVQLASSWNLNLVSDPSLVEFSFIDSSYLTPVEGISSGYTYSSGIIPKTTRSIFETLTPSFGNHPAGKYLVNIYHWGDSYDVKFHISDSTESYYLPTSTNGGVTTLVYNHPGGAFTLDGSFTASNVETSVVEGDVDFNGSSSYGDLVADGPLSWVFNITDIVAIPYEQAADSNFGFFAPIIGFFRDQFSDMKSWIATQIDKIAGDSETKTDVDDAQFELQKEVEDLNNLSGQLDTQASNLEQQFTTDFAIPDTVSGQGTNFQSIYTSLFGSLGVFGIFIWLPIVMAVIKKLLRL